MPTVTETLQLLRDDAPETINTEVKDFLAMPQYNQLEFLIRLVLSLSLVVHALTEIDEDGAA